jgi:uncharacterized paraquat-inducible protein A
MQEDISTITIYDGSQPCRKCGMIMSPIDVMYSEDGYCPYCRNMRHELHKKGAMSG